MNCSRDCFDDNCCMGQVIHGLSPVQGECDFTHVLGEVVPTSVLKDMFTPILDLYEVDGDKSLAEAINEDWCCFISNAIGDRLLNDMLAGTEYEPLLHANVRQVPSIANIQSDWDGFCEDLKHKNRYLVGRRDMIEKLRDFWLDNFVKTIPASQKFYRARTSNSPEKYKSKDMMNPPANLATPGRANPEGISYLYLSSDLETIMYETRSSYLDYVCVATIKAKEEQRIIALKEIQRMDPFSLEDNHESILYNSKLTQLISQSLSRPLRRFDSKTEYVPTQYICEYIKSLDMDGIEYGSAMRPNGLNYAFFDGDKFKVTNVKVHEIDRFELSHHVI